MVNPNVWFPTVQHTIKDAEDVIHTIRHAASDQCNYCVVTDAAGKQKPFKVIVVPRLNDEETNFMR